jgi:hypothetical protein
MSRFGWMSLATFGTLEKRAGQNGYDELSLQFSC